MPSIREMILSEDYADIIVPYFPCFLNQYRDQGAQVFNDYYGMIHYPLSPQSYAAYFEEGFFYTTIPKLYTKAGLCGQQKYKEDILEVVPVFPARDGEEEKENFLEKSFEELFTEYYTERKGVEPETELLETLADILDKEREYETDLDKD